MIVGPRKLNRQLMWDLTYRKSGHASTKRRKMAQTPLLLQPRGSYTTFLWRRSFQIMTSIGKQLRCRYLIKYFSDNITRNFLIEFHVCRSSFCRLESETQPMTIRTLSHGHNNNRSAGSTAKELRTPKGSNTNLLSSRSFQILITI